MPLQPNTATVVARDNALPGLALLLDEWALADRIGVTNLERTYLRYKPGVSCCAGFRYTAPDGTERWLVAKAYPKDRFAIISARSERQTGRYRAQLLKEVCVALLPPELDRDIKALRRFFDPERQQRMRRKIFTGRLYRKARFEALRYKPGRRLVARLTDANTGQQALFKVHHSDGFEQARLGATLAHKQGGPALLAANSGLGVLASEWVDGKSLCPTVQIQSLSVIRKAGQALQHYHGLSIRMPFTLGRSDEIAAIEAVIKELQILLPAQSEQLQSLSDRSISALLSHPTRHGLIHGDFNADQVIAGKDGVRVIDWDRVSTGDQGNDIGSFLARLDWQRLAGKISTTTAAEFGAALVSGYTDRRSLPVSVPAQHIRHLILLLSEHFRLQTQDWVFATNRLIDHIETLLEQIGGPSGPIDRGLPYLTDTLDTEVAASMIRHRTGSELSVPPRLVRHKPGRRAIVRYDCTQADGTPRTFLGKMKAKKPDTATPALHNALRDAGMDGAARNSVGVPKALPGCDRMNIWLMDFVPGTCLSNLQGKKGETEPFFNTGAALARFHESGMKTSRIWTIDQEIAVLNTALTRAAEDLPAYRQTLSDLSDQASDLLTSLPEQPAMCIHRDFYPDQVLIDNNRAWLLDLDLVATGDPAIDLGNFQAHVAEFALRTGGDTTVSAAQEAAFVQGYESLFPGIPRPRIAILRTTALLRHIRICMLFNDRRHNVRNLIRECAHLLDEHRQSI